jgi:hypothetical protein
MKRREALKSITTAGVGAVLASCRQTASHSTDESKDNDTKSKLPLASEAEVNAKLANVQRRYGERLTPQQVDKARKVLTFHQKMLETVRAYPLENWDVPISVPKVELDNATRSAILAESSPRH